MRLLENESTAFHPSAPYVPLLSVVLIACLYAGWSAYVEGVHRTYPLDIDGWGFLIVQLKDSQYSFASLFQNSFLKKGPVIPFLFGLCFYVTRFDESIILLNVVAFSLAAGCLFWGFCYLGAKRSSAAAAIILWILYLRTHQYVFGYYFTEPIIALMSAVLFLMVAYAASRRTIPTALITGAIAGLLVLARPPFLFVISGIPLFYWNHAGPSAKRVIIYFAVGFFLIFGPWPIRNFITYGEFIPFTSEGSLVLFQGTYLEGDSAVINDLKAMPKFKEIAYKTEGRSELDQYHYWKQLAIKQIRQNPIGQIRLIFRKALRFWVYLPQHSWIPSPKTAGVAIISLTLAAIGFIQHRRNLLLQLCALWTIGLWGFHAIVHSELRYNFPIVPMMLMMAMQGSYFVVSRFWPASSSLCAESLSKRAF